ncbi:radical SAM protein [Halanaerobaculum tunisiense]
MIIIEYTEQQLAILSAQRYNILPITSVCNMNCLFCSHQGNPAEVETYAQGHRSLEEIKELLEMLDAKQKIVIGESITRICEGEPTVHPQFNQVLELLRDEFPTTLIKLTTNGSNLTTDRLNLLATLEPLEVNLSLNSATLEGRAQLMKDRQGEVAIKAAQGLQERDITYHGSIVALPHLVGWKDLEETISYLNQTGAETIRVFLPGYTKYSPQQMKFDLSLWHKLEEFIAHCRTDYQVPITLEPEQITDLQAVVTGVISDSPAARANIVRDDRIIAVNKQSVLSRVNAFHKLVSQEDPLVTLEREGRELEQRLNKQAGAKPGMVFSYDLDPAMLAEVKRLIRSYQAEKILLLTSQLAEARLETARDLLIPNQDREVEVLAVENQFFGGSILSAGLLTVSDLRQSLTTYQKELADFDLVLAPQIAFDFTGCDLVGENYQQLEEEFGIEIELVG